MNLQQAKLLSLPDLLSKLGHSPVKERKGGAELWYCSPFRNENEPSFHTTLRNGRWIWNDFGDQGGTVIEFVVRYRQRNGQPSSFKDALAFLDDLYQPTLFSPPRSQPQANTEAAPSFSFHQSKHRAAVENFSENRDLEFIDAKPIQSRAILNYLTQERHIPAELIHRYLQEVRYRNLASGKEYFAFGMPNQAGGYEIRVASSKYSFKSALKARDITVIHGSDPTSRSVAVFEGMTDFLSLLALTSTVQWPDEAIIMHSLSSYRRTADAIRAEGYERINTYLDNNRPGQEGTERFKAEFGERVFPQSQTFAPHVDLNDALRGQITKSRH